MSPTEDSLIRLRRTLARAREDPLGAASELEQMAARCLEVAKQLRLRAAEQTRSTGGAGDRVQIQVRGPNDVVTQTVDTGAEE